GASGSIHPRWSTTGARRVARTRPWSWRNLSLRSKLGLGLGSASILSIVIGAGTAMILILSGLADASRREAMRSAKTALNLVLRQAQSQQSEAGELASDGVLADLLVTSPAAIENYLTSQQERFGSGLIEVADTRGRIVARRLGLDPARARQVAAGDHSPAVERALEYERQLTLTQVSGTLAVRASPPVLDETWKLRGAVVFTLPLDAEFADVIKGALSVDVIFYAGDVATASTFSTPDGRRLPGRPVPPAVAESVHRGLTLTDQGPVEGREYTFAYVPLQDLAGRRIGMLAIATSRDALLAAQRQAKWFLLLAAAVAAVLAAAFAIALARRIAGPVRRLHEGALAVARGHLEHRIPVETGDEIGELAQAFGVMTRALKENQDRLAARIREMVTLHEIGRAVSSVLALDDVLAKVTSQVAGILQARTCALLLEGPGGGLGLRAAYGPISSAQALTALAIRAGRHSLRVEAIESDGDLGTQAREAGITGAFLAVPLELKDRSLGALAVTRPDPFSDGDERLVATIADQAATAFENARLYGEVTAFSEDLERKV